MNSVWIKVFFMLTPFEALKEASSDVRANSVVCQEITRDIPYDTRAIIVLWVW
jgi:hypothetical protein